MQHTWPSELFTPCNRFGSQLLQGSRWVRLQPSEHCQTFENDSSRLLVSILTTSKIHKVANLENKVSADARECTSFARNSRTDNAVCAGASSRWRIQSSAISVRSWVRHYATIRKVVGSIPNEVTGFFNRPKSFQLHYGPGVDTASNRKEYQKSSWG
jgi:hypothetical protein